MTQTPDSVTSARSVTDASLAETDPELAAVLTSELGRQRGTLEMIASENFAPRAVLEAQGSVLTNKYAEGYPGKRYYGGCEYVDVAEDLARERVKQLFGAAYANVQPHSGAQANAAAMHALIRHGDGILGLELAHGGHLTHGMKINFSGRLYEVAAYGVDPQTFRVDMDVVREKALEHRPKLIIAGWSAYPRQLDFEAFASIAAEVDALLMVDMAHFAGLVAAGLHPSPLPHADVVTSTTHKTLAGPRGGIILARDETNAKKFQSAVFPGQQGGPLMHVIAAKAAAFKIALGAEFRERQERTLRGARILAERLLASDARGAGVSVLTGGTDVHLVLVDLRESQLDGQQAEDRLHEVGITVNRNAVPFDPRPPMVTSGLRIGTPALATRGFGDEQFEEVADVIASALQPTCDIAALRTRVEKLADEFPLYSGLEGLVTASTTARVLDGKAALASIKAELAGRVRALAERGVVPGLGTVLVGDDPGSSTYVAMKHRDCAEVGITSIRVDLPATATQAEVEDAVLALNEDPACTGYIVQLPLPRGLDADAVLELIDPAKDADGLHPTNLGRLVLNVNAPMTSPLPCTPHGIVDLLLRNDIDLNGAEVCVLGRGVTVGRPLGLLLTRRSINATVTLCHTGTVDVAGHLRRADVIVAAAGVPGIITADMVKPGAIVLDVGVSRVVGDDGRSRLAGDVAADVRDVAAWVAPNPGGVGPMTRAMLLTNVVDAATTQPPS